MWKLNVLVISLLVGETLALVSPKLQKDHLSANLKRSTPDGRTWPAKRAALIQLKKRMNLKQTPFDQISDALSGGGVDANGNSIILDPFAPIKILTGDGGERSFDPLDSDAVGSIGEVLGKDIEDTLKESVQDTEDQIDFDKARHAEANQAFVDIAEDAAEHGIGNLKDERNPFRLRIEDEIAKLVDRRLQKFQRELHDVHDATKPARDDFFDWLEAQPDNAFGKDEDSPFQISEGATALPNHAGDIPIAKE